MLALYVNYSWKTFGFGGPHFWGQTHMSIIWGTHGPKQFVMFRNPEFNHLFLGGCIILKYFKPHPHHSNRNPVTVDDVRLNACWLSYFADQIEDLKHQHGKTCVSFQIYFRRRHFYHMFLCKHLAFRFHQDPHALPCPIHILVFNSVVLAKSNGEFGWPLMYQMKIWHSNEKKVDVCLIFLGFPWFYPIDTWVSVRIGRHAIESTRRAWTKWRGDIKWVKLAICERENIGKPLAFLGV